MILKYCLNNTIHKVFAHPPTFEALIDDIKAVFKDKVSSNFSIQYRDSDGDLITVSSEMEYQSMFVFDLTKSMDMIKIYITPLASQDSFEVVSEGNNSHSIIEIGDKSLSFSQEDDNNTRTMVENQVLIQSEGDQDEPRRPESEGPSSARSITSLEESLAKLEARAVELKRQIKLFAYENDLEVSFSDERRGNNRFSGAQSGSQRLQTEYYSVEDSIISKEVDEAVEDIASRQVQKVFRRVLGERQEERQRYYDLLEHERREEEFVMNMAALKIQNAFRSFKLKRALNNFMISSSCTTEVEREQRIQRTRQRVSELIQRALTSHHQRLEDINRISEQLTNDNIDIHSTTKRNWGFDNMEVKDYRESDYDSEEDDGTIYSGGLKPAGQDLDSEKSATYPSPSKDAYIRCRLDLSSGGNSLQSPSTAKINEAYNRLRALKENQPHEYYDYSIVDLGTADVFYYYDNEYGRRVSRTVYIQNIGTKPWRKCIVKSYGDIRGKEVQVYNVEVGETRLVNLEIGGNVNPGPYISEWRLIHESENGVVEFIGCPFRFGVTIEGEKEELEETHGRQEQRKLDNTEDYFYDVEEEDDEYFSAEQKENSSQEEVEEEYNDEFEEDTEEEEDEQVEKDESQNYESDVVFKKYLNYREELAKVWEVRKLFPQDSLERILDFVQKNSYLCSDDMLMAYWAARKQINN